MLSEPRYSLKFAPNDLHSVPCARYLYGVYLSNCSRSDCGSPSSVRFRLCSADFS